MANLLVDERDQDFVLYELLNIEELTKHEPFTEFNRKETFDPILTESRKMGMNIIYPTLAEADKVGCKLENGAVKSPECFRSVLKAYKEGGWTAVTEPQEDGGMGLPVAIDVAAKENFYVNFAFMAYPGLAEGSAHLIHTFGNEAQKKKYLEKMFDGTWGGTMCLTEPQAGSDVGAAKTTAKKLPNGKYLIRGTKQFITSGDTDLYSNVIHPVLARVEGDPPGTKGLSLFIVPKIRVKDDGSLGEKNDVSVGSIEHKLGINGSATCVMNFGENDACEGELLGEQGSGMKVMFQLMNEARIMVGMQGLSSGSAAYLHALQYSKERLQGSSVFEMKNPTAPKVTIINHPDVRRMLMWMKAHTEGMRALLFFTAWCLDMTRCEGVSDEEKTKWLGMAEVLTPICKAYSTDTGFRITEMAMQTYGGVGYTRDFPAEQLLRDAKIASIYEGTNGIQALDLVGRKLGQKGGMNFMGLIQEMNSFIDAHENNAVCKEYVAAFKKSVGTLSEVAFYFTSCAMDKKFLIPVANANTFLTLMSKVVMQWFLTRSAVIAADKLAGIATAKGVDLKDAKAVAKLCADNKDAAFYNGKLASCNFFTFQVLPEVEAHAASIKSEQIGFTELPEECFTQN